MNTKNLILTPTKTMDRAQWLQFRQPAYHVGQLLLKELGYNPIIAEKQFNSPELYEKLITFFRESDVWESFVFPCIGGSEMAIIMGLNEYKSSIELFYEKVGIKPVPDFDNAAMFWGRELEEQIADKWQYWDGSIETLIENFSSKKVLRKNRRINAYMQNKDFKHIFVSIDRIINKMAQSKEGSLECKTISGWAADKWEAGIPPQYVIQNQTQLLVPGFDYGEIAVLKDGRHFDVLPFDRNENICESILTMSTAFFNRVKGAIEYFFLSEAAYDDLTRQTNLSICDTFAPDADGSVAYENYLKSTTKDEGGAILGTEVEYKLAELYESHREKIETLNGFVRECANKLKQFMGNNSRLYWAKPGSEVTWRANKNGVRSFKVMLKD